MRCLMPMFWEEGWEYHGEFFDFPLRNVVPKPRQQPHPPLWVACSQLDTIEMAGRRGIGALGFQFVSAEAAHAWVHAYYNSFTKRLELLGPYRTNPNIAVVSQFMCAETDEEARRRADGSTFFQFALRFYNTHGPVEPGTVSLWDEYQAWKATPEGQKAQHGGLIGSPETIRRQAAQVRRVQRRPGDPAQPGRPQPPRAHLRGARAVRHRGDARVPRHGARAPGVEAAGARRRARADRDRHRARTTSISPQSTKWKPGMQVPTPDLTLSECGTPGSRVRPRPPRRRGSRPSGRRRTGRPPRPTPSGRPAGSAACRRRRARRP